MNKRKLHHKLVVLRRFPALILLAAALFSGLVSVFALRANNHTMIELRQAVYEADEQGGDIEGALRELREHVYSHMNTNLTSGQNSIYPPIQLEHTYERLVEAEQARLQQVNASVYAQATAHCESIYGAGAIIPRAQCVGEFVAARGVETVTIPESLYKFDFVSPAWSPDLAGWSLVLSVLFSLLFVFRLISEWLIRLELDK